ncbi:MAG TPA: hypothetical protein VGN52_11350 [Burkholderiales bacterium]|jgi:hypothetical protein
MPNLKIACIGWGSLIWDSRELPVAREWPSDGPILPVEFARESSQQRITLVICPGLKPVQTLWALMDVPSVDAGVTALAYREDIKKDPRWGIGFWNRETQESRNDLDGVIAAWARHKGLDGAVWTSLKCGFKDAPKTMPTAEQVVSHLKALNGENRAKAEEYVRRAPRQIDTEYRRAIEKELGWQAA